MDIEGFKWLSLVIVAITTFVGNILILFINKPSYTSKLESLAGGVFLGAGLAHLLNDAFTELYNESTYPIAPAVAACTFMLLSAIEMYTYSEQDAANDNYSGEYSEVTPDIETPQESSQQSQSKKKKRKFFGDSNENMTIATISLYIIMDVHSVIEGLAFFTY